MTRPLVFGLAAAAAAVLLAACGGEDAPARGEPLTKVEWIAQADAICAEANQRIAALGEPKTADELASIAGDSVAINDEARALLQALTPPTEIEAQVDRALELTERQSAVIGEIAEAAEDRDQARAEMLLAELASLEQEADGLAAAIGLEQCGRD